MRRLHIYILILLSVLVTCPTDSHAKDKKKKNEVEVKMYEPDAVPTASRAKPDIPAPRIKQPHHFRLSSGSDHASGIQGIDVSHYQNSINWKALSKTSIPQFVYIKATEGKSVVDSKYSTYFREARNNGFKVGSYHFFRPGVDVETQYNLFIGHINVKEQDLLPLIDVETIAGVESIVIFQRRLLTFCKLVAHAFNGQKPLIYTGKSFYDKYIASNDQLREYQFMIAAYQDEQPVLANGDDYLIWQYTGHGSIEGIKGHVDRSKFVGSHVLSEILVNQKKIPGK